MQGQCSNHLVVTAWTEDHGACGRFGEDVGVRTCHLGGVGIVVGSEGVVAQCGYVCGSVTVAVAFHVNRCDGNAVGQVNRIVRIS